MKNILSTLFLMLSITAFCQKAPVGEGISFRKFKSEHPDQTIDFAVKGDLDQIKTTSNLHYKYSNHGWHFIRANASSVSQLLSEGVIEQIYFEPAQGKVLNDTMRVWTNIDSVHDGNSPLISGFTGKDVIIGYIDTGIDYNHLDFKNADGSTRVLYYWDHSLPNDPQLTPGKYGYGVQWDSTHINAGTCTSLDNNAHGTTVSGAGSGNGLATGTNKGAAPESDIIIVETNFNLPNWTLTVADGVDFIFAMADTLGKPAVVNTSVGGYLGSHDGTDPASHVIDSLLDDKTGRIVVSAAGNSGNKGKYHASGIVDADTSFTWGIVNPSSAFGSPAVYFDIWSDTLDFQNVEFAFRADNPIPNYNFRNRTAFYSIQSLLNTTTFDTIKVGPDVLAPVEFYCEEVNGVYHIEAVLQNIDSTTYLYGFETTGSGNYDLWSGAWLGASDLKTTGLPTTVDFPAIAHYHMPDSLTTIVSSWICSPKVVAVGNFTNQKTYLDYNSNPYVGAYPPGELSINSSKGPNRKGIVKPDVSAPGDLILAACPLWLSASLQGSNPAMLAEGGQHVRNGGTSMASPVIAGIAALYLEKCPNSSYQDFIDDLLNNASGDSQTGAVPNMGYGYGRVDAFGLLNTTNFDTFILGDTLICEDPVIFSTTDVYQTYDWNTGETTSTISINNTDTISVLVTNDEGCESESDTIVVIKGTPPTFPIINEIGGGLITSPADSVQWYLDGVAIDSSNAQYCNPDTTGSYTVEVFGPEGCSFLSDPYFVELSQIHELNQNEFVIFPNPFKDYFNIIKSDFYDISFIVTDISGKVVYNYTEVNSSDLFVKVDLQDARAGVYFITIYYADNFNSFKLIKE
ncbi:MAG: S8 family peptidase [Crocinitomicaceae bacterium]